MTFEQLLWMLTLASSLVGLGSGVFLYRSSNSKPRTKALRVLPTKQFDAMKLEPNQVRQKDPLAKSLSITQKLTRIVQMKDELNKRNGVTSPPTQLASEGFVENMDALIKFMEK